MEFNRENILNRSTTAKKAVVMDEGLRAYMLKSLQLHGNRSVINWNNCTSVIQDVSSNGCKWSNSCS